MEKNPLAFFLQQQFVPSLQQALEVNPLDLKKMIVVVASVKDPNEVPPRPPTGFDRGKIVITDGKDVCRWEVGSLVTLFRGDQQPPVLGDYPAAYNDSFMLLDSHALEMSKIFGDRRDEEMKEIYSALRRRPDGRSMGFFHDYMWQAAALVLGTRPLSKAEFDAIMSRLERSCRTFERGPTSRNYIATLRQTIG